MTRTALRSLALSALLIPCTLSAQAISLVGPDGAVDWNRFYTAAETNQILREFHALYPDLTELYAVGESYRGQPLMLMEITNEGTGPAEEKPALYVDGGIHAGELTGSAVGNAQATMFVPLIVVGAALVLAVGAIILLVKEAGRSRRV